MSELNGTNFNKFNPVGSNVAPKVSAADKPVEEIKAEPDKINDFSNPHAEIIGRSMLSIERDSTKNDLDALIENPQIAENSDKMFEFAYAQAVKIGVENPYEEAASFSTSQM